MSAWPLIRAALTRMRRRVAWSLLRPEFIAETRRVKPHVEGPRDERYDFWFGQWCAQDHLMRRLRGH